MANPIAEITDFVLLDGSAWQARCKTKPTIEIPKAIMVQTPKDIFGSGQSIAGSNPRY